MRTINFLFILLFISPAYATEVSKEIESLGTGPSLKKRAYKLSKSSRYRVIQKRSVDRNYRFELGITGAKVFGGDSYYSTAMHGFNLNFHFTPKWSVGLSHYIFSNDLTSEGARVANQSLNNFNNNNVNVGAVDFDWPVSANFININWYPIYGKLNLFDQAITHFDIYTNIGVGQMNLRSKQEPALTMGLGIGFWWTKYFTSRFEIRYNGYKDNLRTGPRQLETMVLSASIGVLL